MANPFGRQLWHSASCPPDYSNPQSVCASPAGWQRSQLANRQHVREAAGSLHLSCKAKMSPHDELTSVWETMTLPLDQHVARLFLSSTVDTDLKETLSIRTNLNSPKNWARAVWSIQQGNWLSLPLLLKDCKPATYSAQGCCMHEPTTFKLHSATRHESGAFFDNTNQGRGLACSDVAFSMHGIELYVSSINAAAWPPLLR